MKKYIIFAVAAMAFAACTNEEEILDDSPVAVRISAGVSTRAIDDMWEQDQIGVMVTGGNATMAELYKNVWYYTDATGTDKANFTAYHANSPIYFKGTEEATFAAYGPYKMSDANVLPGTDGVISKTDGTKYQNSESGRRGIDYIYASGEKGSLSRPDIAFKFKHVMARLIIKVQASTDSGITADQIKDGSYYLSGFVQSGTFNVVTGEAKADENAQATDGWSLETYSMVEKGTDDITFTAILYPQTLSKALVFNALIGVNSYTATFKPELKSGESFTANITVRKGEIAMSGSSIEVWTVNANSGQDVDAGRM